MDSLQAVRQTRSYQQEMYERSMEGNTIVMMDTGSGKTHVAVMRIQAELDRCHPDKRVWFLAPTVELCKQQHAEISRALPAYQHRLLTGEDNVDCWSEQSIWDAALDQVRVVVSTHAVLADALGHGFVKMSELALIVFDEGALAHYCVGKHPANIIMKNFYHDHKKWNSASEKPHILGLSASLIMRSKIKSMEVIEANLDSTSVTPRIHREELLSFVHRPECQLILYDDNNDQNQMPQCLSLIEGLCTTLETPKGMQELRFRTIPGNEQVQGNSTKIAWEVKTALKTLHRRAKVIHDGLGQWALCYFLKESLWLLQKGAETSDELFIATDTSKKAVLALLMEAGLPGLCEDSSEPRNGNTSSKVQKLIAYLLAETIDEPVGIVFVEQRVMTNVLTALLQRHHDTKDKFRCAPFVGASNVVARKHKIPELVDTKGQAETLQKFREGELNLLVATTVLEEGIDVQTCNLVACFDRSANVKSFIQRRGRARHVRSRLAVFLSATGDHDVVKKWQSIEDELSRICQSDEERQRAAAVEENKNEVVDYELTSHITGAKLTADAAVSHLHHFCNKLPHRSFVDYSPLFSYKEVEGKIQASVVLPNCLSPHLRHAISQSTWSTERSANKDVAFQAYLALYRAGLVNENLLPIGREETLDNDDPIRSTIELDEIEPQMNLWTEMESSQPSWHENIVTVLPPAPFDEEKVQLRLLTPINLDSIPPLTLYWSSGAVFTVEIGRTSTLPCLDNDELKSLCDTTNLLYMAPRPRGPDSQGSNFVTLFAPSTQSNLRGWLTSNNQTRNASVFYGTTPPRSFLRGPLANNTPRIFHSWLLSEEGERLVRGEKLPRRRNFRSPIDREMIDQPNSKADVKDIPLERCEFDSLDLCFARIGLFMPDILQHIQDSVITARLRSTILSDLPLRNSELVHEAICAPSAMRSTNYQRLEFLGDAFLKYAASCHLFTQHVEWHEGLLSEKRDHLVSNENLSGAAMACKLPKFMITENVPYKGWKVPTFSDQRSASRTISQKMMADVVESLIGAAWLDCGEEAARQCVHLFLPAISSSAPNFAINTFVSQVNFGNVAEVESLIGYEFRHKSLLLEALTHPSCGGHSQTDSYQRLEYLGDAVLDVLIVRMMMKYRLSEGAMTRLKHALVNGRLLGFMCLNLHRQSTQRDVEAVDRYSAKEITRVREVHLASFMRARSSDLSIAQRATEERFAELGDVIRRQLDTAKDYPWIELLELRPEKFLSDLVESIIGAIFVDSEGDLSPCHAFVDQLGLTKYMGRIVAQSVNVRHPRDRLQHLVAPKAFFYDVWRRERDGKYNCGLKVDDLTVAEVEGCWDREEAITKVACRAEKALAATKLYK